MWYWLISAAFILLLVAVLTVFRIVVHRAVRRKQSEKHIWQHKNHPRVAFNAPLCVLLIRLFDRLQRPEGYNANFHGSYTTWLPPGDEQEILEENGGFPTDNPVIETTPVRHASLRVFTGTWNLGDRPPPYERLKDWFFGETSAESSLSAPFDIMAIGVQECSYMHRLGFESCEKDWASAVSDAVGADFELVSATSLRDSMRLLLYVRKKLLTQVHSIRSATYSTTIPMFWRKGGIGVQISYLSTTLVFISCHLAAHAKQMTNRNNDVGLILKSLGLGNPNYDAGHQFDHCFFMGDLNYRIESFEWSEAAKLIEEQKWPTLFAKDQLHTAQESGKVLYGFTEPPLTFAPTFKVDRGTRHSYNRMRTPSWCDRILLHSLPNCSATSLAYNSVDSILTSDHVPIYATWKVQIPIIKLRYRNENALRVYLTSTTRSPSPFATNLMPPTRTASALALSTNDIVVRPALTESKDMIAPAPVLMSASAAIPIIHLSDSGFSINKSGGSHPLTASASVPNVGPISCLDDPLMVPSTTPSPNIPDWNLCSQILNADAARFQIELSNVSFQLLPDATFKKFTVLEISPRILLSSPMMSEEPFKAIVKMSNEKWLWERLPPVLTKKLTPNALSHHHLFIAVYHYLTPTKEKMVAHAVIPINNHLASPALFELPLIHCGIRKGTIQGLLGLRKVDSDLSSSSDS